MTYIVSLFNSAKDNAPKTVQVTWEQLLSELSAHEPRAEKDGPAWSPAAFEGTRSNANARRVSLAVFDLDDCGEETLGNLGARLEGTLYAIHSTYSHGCYRLVLPLTEPVDPRIWPATWEAIRLRFEIPADPACRDPARLYYFPSHPLGGTGQCFDGRGAALEPPLIPFLNLEHPEEPKAQLALPAGAHKNFAAEPVDMLEIRKQLRAVRKPESAKLIRMVLEGESLHGPEGRDATMNRVASLLASSCTPALTWPVALELLRPSLHATPQERAGHIDHWIAEMSDMFQRALERRAKSDAKDAELQAVLKRATGRDDSPKGEGDLWRSALLVTLDKEGEETGLKQVGANADLILRNDPVWAGQLRFNEVTKEIDVLGGPALNFSKSSLDVEIANWLARSDYRLSLRTQVVAEQMLAASRRNAYDPLADWLESLIWDGTKRIRNFLAHYFGAVGNPDYLGAVSETWLTAAVARALQPGCKMDNVLVLQGEQGKKKSMALDILGGKYFSDTKFTIGDKDGMMMASRFWIIEIAELAAMRSADNQTLKAFLSRRADDLRVPYGKVLEHFLRRCLFVGTTNEDEYLTDPTGNRRYLPVKISNILVDELAADRNQLWAEAVALFKSGAKWWLEGPAAELAAAEASLVTNASPYTETILAWWLKLSRRPEIVTTMQIASDALNMLTAQVTRAVQQEIGNALRSLGFKRGKKRVNGIPTNVYHVPETLKDAPKDASVLQLAKGLV